MGAFIKHVRSPFKRYNARSAIGLPGSSGLPNKSEALAYYKGDPLTDSIGKLGSLTFHDAVCGTADITTEFQFSELTGTESVDSSGGTSTPSVSAGKITFDAGTVWKIELDNGWTIPVSEGDGTKIYAYDDQGNNYVGDLVSAPAGFWTDNTQDDFFHDWEYGFTEDSGAGAELLSNGDFSDGSSGWNEANSPSFSVSEGVATVTYNGQVFPRVYQHVENTEGDRFTAFIYVEDVVGMWALSLTSNSNGGITAPNTDITLKPGLNTIPPHISGALCVVAIRCASNSAGDTVSFSTISSKRIPDGRIPANPNTGMSCLGQTLSTAAKSLKSVSFAFPYGASLDTLNTSLGGSFFYSGVTPIIRSYWAWRQLTGVNDSSDGRVNIGPTMIPVYSPAQTEKFEKIQKYIKNLALLGALSGDIDVSDNLLLEKDVDDLLCYLAAAATGTGTLDISGNNSAPSTAGTACKDALVLDGWTVTVTI